MLIAITGGIGSGKSFVCRKLAERGVQVYDCDKAAKRLMRSSTTLQQELNRVVGTDVFPNGKLDKALLSKFIVSSDDNAQKIDAVVHPAVARDFLDSGMEWLESAILFEAAFHARVHFDYIVCVSAPLEVRIQRVMKRDGINRDKALGWINRQIPQEEKVAQSDFIIENDGQEDRLDEQIGRLLEEINKIKSKQNN